MVLMCVNQVDLRDVRLDGALRQSGDVDSEARIDLAG